MYPELRENRPQGTLDFPFTKYHIQHQKKPFHIPVHWHDEVEIIYLKKGKLRVSIGEEEFDVLPGDIHFVNSGELHFMESDDLSVDYYTLLFPLEFISFQTNDQLEREVLRPLRGKKLLFPKEIAKKVCLKEIADLLENMIQAYEEKKAGYQLRIRILLLQVLEELIKEDCFCKPSFQNTSDIQRDMLLYIQNHFTEKITLKILAEEFHLSEKYVSRYFKEHFSISFMQYVGHLRMTKAKMLLAATDMQITEVALSCGYPSVNLFIRSFKEIYQITPLQYRKKEG